MKRSSTYMILFVLAFYFFYSLSPLLYCLEPWQSDGQWEGQDGTSFVSADHDPNAHPAVSIGSYRLLEDVSNSPYVMLKKKRAIHISSKEMIARLSRQVADVSDIEPVFDTADKGIVLYVLNDDLNCPNGFPFYHSGISPPSA